jgi:hypothetical protein
MKELIEQNLAKLEQRYLEITQEYQTIKAKLVEALLKYETSE